MMLRGWPSVADLPKQPSKPGFKTPGSETAGRPTNGKPNTALQREAAAPPGQDQDALRKWVKQMESSEGASRMGRDMLETGPMGGGDLLDSVAADLGMEKIDLATVQFSPELIEQVKIEVAKKYGVLPIKFN